MLLGDGWPLTQPAQEALAKLQQLLARYEQQLPELTEQLGDADLFVVATRDEYELAGGLYRVLSTAKRRLDELRLELGRPLDALKNRAQEPIKAQLERVAKALGKLDQGLREWERVERQRVEAERKAAEEKAQLMRQEAGELLMHSGGDQSSLEDQTAMELLAKAQDTEAAVQGPTKVAGMHTREVWKYRVTDFSKLPDTYKVENAVALNKVAGIVKGRPHPELPGVEFYPEVVRIGRTVEGA